MRCPAKQLHKAKNPTDIFLSVNCHNALKYQFEKSIKRSFTVRTAVKAFAVNGSKYNECLFSTNGKFWGLYKHRVDRILETRFFN